MHYAKSRATVFPREQSQRRSHRGNSRLIDGVLIYSRRLQTKNVSIYLDKSLIEHAVGWVSLRSTHPTAHMSSRVSALTSQVTGNVTSAALAPGISSTTTPPSNCAASRAAGAQSP